MYVANDPATYPYSQAYKTVEMTLKILNGVLAN